MFNVCITIMQSSILRYVNFWSYRLHKQDTVLSFLEKIMTEFKTPKNEKKKS